MYPKPYDRESPGAVEAAGAFFSYGEAWELPSCLRRTSALLRTMRAFGQCLLSAKKRMR
jgi:hypothetical protein